MKRIIRNISLTAGALLSLSSGAEAQMPSFADLAEKLSPTVVNISSFNHNADNELDDENTFPEESLGSGFIIDGQGYIITNNHVIDKADSISVTLSDNTKANAEIIGKDTKTDIALIKIPSNTTLPSVTFGDSDKIRVGDWILAIGNPFGLGGSVTAGIISAKSRDIEAGPYDNFIQTDASINQGNSGGPMFNMDGEVIGINSAIFSTTGAGQGVGFAIPANLAQWIVGQLKQNGTVKRGWIGIKIQPNTPDIAANLNISPNQGVIVSGITENSPAQRADIQTGDIILNFNKHAIDNTKNLSRMIAETPIGTQAPVELWRNGQKVTATVSVELMPEEKTPASTPKTNDENIEQDKAQSSAGISVSDITPENLDRYNLNQEMTGVIVSDILPNSDAARKGIKIGDIIIKVDKRNIINAEDFNEYIQEAKRENNRPVLLAVQGNDTVHYVAVKLMPHD